MRRRALAPALLGVLGALAMAGALPPAAEAHGPIAPIATSYLAKVNRAPAGLDAKVVDGYLRMWLRVPPAMTVVVLDYRGAPYLRFSRAGVYVNEASEMYYLNSVPPLIPPLSLSRTTPPRWRRVSTGHEYGWHDGRVGALTATALAPGASYVGSWRISVLVDGRLSAISGGLWHAGRPSLVWLWPIVVLLACLLAVWRLRRAALDARIARALAFVVLLAVGAGAAGRELQARPTIGVGQLVITGLLLALVACGLGRVLFRRVGYVLNLVIAFVALWIGFELVQALVRHFVLTSVPVFVVRTAAAVCLGGGAGLLLLVSGMVLHGHDEDPCTPGDAPTAARDRRAGGLVEQRGSAAAPGARPQRERGLGGPPVRK